MGAITNLLGASPLMKPRWSDDTEDADSSQQDRHNRPGRERKVLSDAFANAHGQLHSDLNVPQGQRINKSKLIAASQGKYGKKAKKRAQPVINMQRARAS